MIDYCNQFAKVVHNLLQIRFFYKDQVSLFCYQFNNKKILIKVFIKKIILVIKVLVLLDNKLLNYINIVYIYKLMNTLDLISPNLYKDKLFISLNSYILELKIRILSISYYVIEYISKNIISSQVFIYFIYSSILSTLLTYLSYPFYLSHLLIYLFTHLLIHSSTYRPIYSFNHLLIMITQVFKVTYMYTQPSINIVTNFKYLLKHKLSQSIYLYIINSLAYSFINLLLSILSLIQQLYCF